jgi:hypothetical protein
MSEAVCPLPPQIIIAPNALVVCTGTTLLLHVPYIFRRHICI